MMAACSVISTPLRTPLVLTSPARQPCRGPPPSGPPKSCDTSLPSVGESAVAAKPLTLRSPPPAHDGSREASTAEQA